MYPAVFFGDGIFFFSGGAVFFGGRVIFFGGEIVITVGVLLSSLLSITSSLIAKGTTLDDALVGSILESFDDSDDSIEINDISCMLGWLWAWEAKLFISSVDILGAELGVWWLKIFCDDKLSIKELELELLCWWVKFRLWEEMFKLSFDGSSVN